MGLQCRPGSGRGDEQMGGGSGVVVVVRCRQRMSMSMSLASTLRMIYQPRSVPPSSSSCALKSRSSWNSKTPHTTPTPLELGIIRVHDTAAVPPLLPALRMHRFCSSPLRCSSPLLVPRSPPAPTPTPPLLLPGYGPLALKRPRCPVAIRKPLRAK